MAAPELRELLAMSRTRAVIDIGSNTVRLVIYGEPLRAPTVLLNEKVTARLGRGVAETGMLADTAMHAALKALARFGALVRLKGITEVHTVATAAVREAQNGSEFLAAVGRLGLDPRLLSGEEEAAASATGVIAAFPGARGTVADLGGGSLELMCVGNEACGPGITLPVGTLRLPEWRAAGPEAFARRVHQGLRTGKWRAPAGETLYLVGGAHRALASLSLHRLDWPDDDPHGFEMSGEAAAKLCRSVARGKVPVSVPGVSNSRLAALPNTAALLAVLLRELAPARIVFSSWGLREGLLHARLDPATRSQDPLLAGVAAFAEVFGVSAATALKLAGWTAPANPPNGTGSEALRLASTMLALASQASEPNLRADEAVTWALRKRWIGISATERAIMAAAVLGNTGRKDLPSVLARLAPEALLREAFAWGLALRLCRRLTSLLDAVLAGTALSVADGDLRLTLDGGLAVLFTDPIERDLKALAEWLGLTPVVDRNGALP